MTLATGRKLGPYEILAPLGAGGMGEVYLAEDTRLGRKIALKVLPPAFTQNPDRVRRFEREAKAASALNHPNILTIHEIGEADGTHYIVSEYVEGETLHALMQRGRLGFGQAIAIADQVAGALSVAHGAGIIHRDIKPENVMVRPDGLVKVLDFGLAKLTERPAAVPEADSQAETIARLSTEPGMVMGTVSYMSPEQARGLKVDHRTDIFSLGVMLYEMIAGRRPFEGATMSDVMAAILTTEPAPLSQHSPDAPPELERIVAKAVRKNREDRYQVVKDLLVDLKDLEQELEMEAKLGRADRSKADSAAPAASSAAYLLSEIKRHKLSVMLALAALIVALAGISYFTRGRGAIESIAVLPFVNDSADPNLEYLADGIPESIINSLSQLPRLKVMARTTAFRYKSREVDPRKVGQELNVHAVLTGRVIQRGETLTVQADLVDAADGTQLWGERYNRRLSDLIALQEEITGEISDKLRLRLSGAERQQLGKRPTENLKAFQYYMQGRSYADRRTREDVLTAIRYYEKAIEEDRNYALAYAGLADTYAGLGVRGDIAPIEGRRKAEEAARKALSLDENLAEAHLAVGQVYTRFVPYNFSLGDRELYRAIELSPSLALAHHYLGYSLVRQGRIDESLERFSKGRELDPLSPLMARGAAFHYYLKRDYARAFGLLKQSYELGPTISTTYEIGIYIQNKLFSEALAVLEKAKLEGRSDPLLIYSMGIVYAAQGKRPEALQIIRELEGMSGPSSSQAHYIAKIYATLNEKELAFVWLERGLGTGAMGAFYKDDPIWDTPRSDPRFADLVRRMGIMP
jgi:eukaryotic-like serine/threonine-protein kinase